MGYLAEYELLREEVENFISQRAKKEYINTERDYHHLCFNLPFSTYLCCISPTELIDNLGYTHYYSTLSLEDLCKIADALKK